MKRLILIIGIAALLVGVGLGKCANAEDTSVTIGSGSITTDIPASYTGTGHYDEANCAICGKALKEWRRNSSDWYDACLTTDAGVLTWNGDYFEDNTIYHLSYEFNVPVCSRCRDKYKGQITELLKPIADKWLQDRIKENEQRRLENAERERIKRLKELQGKQQDLQRQIDELKQ